MGFRVENMKELVDAIKVDIVKGCKNCEALFEDERDYAFVLETGSCPYCYKALTDVISDYEEDYKATGMLIDRKKVYEGVLEANNFKVSGYKVLKKDTYEFQGLLSCDEAILQYVDEKSVKPLFKPNNGNVLSINDFVQEYVNRAISGKVLKDAMSRIYYLGPGINTYMSFAVQDMMNNYLHGKFQLADDKFYKVVIKQEDDSFKIYEVEGK